MKGPAHRHQPIVQKSLEQMFWKEAKQKWKYYITQYFLFVKDQ